MIKRSRHLCNLEPRLEWLKSENGENNDYLLYGGAIGRIVLFQPIPSITSYFQVSKFQSFAFVVALAAVAAVPAAVPVPVVVVVVVVAVYSILLWL